MQEGVSASTVVRYLLGNRRAIDSLMDCPRAVWLGLLFVTSAGFAREYDAESLLHEPWYLLIPIAASLVTSFLLYCLLSVVALNSGAKEERFWTLYVAFLTLYWMTAPLAWLYALPVERFLPPLQAAQVNYGLLAIVSMWRVLLITRAASTFFSAPVVPVFWIVMLFADSIVVIASFALPQPVLQVMSGVRLNPLEELNAIVAGSACCFGVLLWPVFLLFAATTTSWSTHTWSLPPEPAAPLSVRPSAWRLGAASLVIWAAIVPFTQPQQYLRFEVEKELTQGDLRRGLAMMSAHQPSDFPLDWNPPPRWSEHGFEPALEDVLTTISNESVAEWVAQRYWSKAGEMFRDYSLWDHGPHDPTQSAYVVYLDLHPERDRVIREAEPELREFIRLAIEGSGLEYRALADEFKRLLDSISSETNEDARDTSTK